MSARKAPVPQYLVDLAVAIQKHNAELRKYLVAMTIGNTILFNEAKRVHGEAAHGESTADLERHFEVTNGLLEDVLKVQGAMGKDFAKAARRAGVPVPRKKAASK